MEFRRRLERNSSFANKSRSFLAALSIFAATITLPQGLYYVAEQTRRREVPIKATDILFVSVVGTLLAINLRMRPSEVTLNNRVIAPEPDWDFNPQPEKVDFYSSDISSYYATVDRGDRLN